jgi:hypothetical protein
MKNVLTLLQTKCNSASVTHRCIKVKAPTTRLVLFCELVTIVIDKGPTVCEFVMEIKAAVLLVHYTRRKLKKPLGFGP